MTNEERGKELEIGKKNERKDAKKEKYVKNIRKLNESNVSEKKMDEKKNNNRNRRRRGNRSRLQTEAQMKEVKEGK
jgi:hypothetical protein